MKHFLAGISTAILGLIIAELCGATWTLAISISYIWCLIGVYYSWRMDQRF